MNRMYKTYAKGDEDGKSDDRGEIQRKIGHITDHPLHFDGKNTIYR